MRVGIISDNLRYYSGADILTVNEKPYIFYHNSHIVTDWETRYNVIIMYDYDLNKMYYNKLIETILNCKTIKVVIFSNKSIKLGCIPKSLPMPVIKTQMRVITDNPWNFECIEHKSFNIPRWGSINIRDQNRKILVSMNHRMLWYDDVDLNECMRYAEKMLDLSLSPLTARNTCDEAMPRFRAFMLCIRRWRVPKPLIWIILNLWYFG